MKALLLILGLTFSVAIFAADPPDETQGKLGQTEGCTSAKAMENCECIVNGEGSEHNGQGDKIDADGTPSDGAAR